jgi:hypothetical protein
VIGAERRDQFGGRALGDDPAAIDDGDAVAEHLGLVHVVGREQDRAAVLAEAAQQVPQLPPRLRVEPGRRLVEEQEVGFAGQRAGEREALLLSA